MTYQVDYPGYKNRPGILGLIVNAETPEEAMAMAERYWSHLPRAGEMGVSPVTPWARGLYARHGYREDPGRRDCHAVGMTGRRPTMSVAQQMGSI